MKHETTPRMETTPQTLYHYTGQSGLLGIFESKTLWTSSVRHLNDATELQHALDLARDVLNFSPRTANTDAFSANLDLLQSFTVFAASFSADGGDQLSQWRAYSHNGTGYSIGFDFEGLKKVAGGQDYMLFPCTYDNVQNRQTIQNAIAVAEETPVASAVPPEIRFMMNLMLVAPTMKHSSFKDEQEWRLVVLADDRNVPTKLRNGKSLLIPYRTLNLTENDGGTPVTEVCVGPSPHMSLSVETLHAYGQQFLGKIQVRASAVPYRDW